MPRETAHVSLVLRNVEVVCHLIEDGRYPDWAVVVAFYAALHAIETILSCDNPPTHGQSHVRRNGILLHEKRFEKILTHYRPLENASCVARYLEESSRSGQSTTFSQYMSPQRVLDQAVKNDLVQILKSAAGLLGKGKSSEAFRDALKRLRTLALPADTTDPEAARG